nr:beta-ketoacyl-ACP synthase III [Goodfellowiella coeruleoviolacea]
MALRQRTGPAHTRLLGFGSAQGNRVVTNDDMAKLVDTSDEWIRQRVGIVERRLADEDQSLVDMATAAGAKALANSGTSPDEVDTVIVATCTLVGGIPNAAARVADRVGIVQAAAFDLNAACAGFPYSVMVASDLIRGGSARKVLVIGAERFTDWVDWTDRANCVIFGDGAGAAVVAPSEEPMIGPVVWGSNGDLADLIYLRENRYVFQQGQSVYRWATTQIWPIAERAVAAAGLSLADIDVLVPHQANLRIVEALARKLRANGARAEMVVADDITYSGNTSAASIPLALDHMTAAGQVHSGDVMLLVGFGAGLSYAAQVAIAP